MGSLRQVMADDQPIASDFQYSLHAIGIGRSIWRVSSSVVGGGCDITLGISRGRTGGCSSSSFALALASSSTAGAPAAAPWSSPSAFASVMSCAPSSRGRALQNLGVARCPPAPRAATAEAAGRAAASAAPTCRARAGARRSAAGGPTRRARHAKRARRLDGGRRRAR